MDIYPAIDLRNGSCVRLTQGDFAAETIYESDPIKQAALFEAAGAKWLHIVDLDGAKAGLPQQTELIKKIISSTSLNVQVGGGIRAATDVERLLASGAQRVIVGSMAIKQPEEVYSWFSSFGAQHLVLALDIRLDTTGTPEVLTQGWQVGSQMSAWDVLERFSPNGLQTLLCTDVSRDGMLGGTNRALYSAIQARYPQLAILASGGVNGADELRELHNNGLAGAIVGRAIYEKKLDLASLIKELTDAG